VNDFLVDEEPEVEPLRVTKEALNRQLARLKKVRSSRDKRKWRKALDALHNAAAGKANTMPRILDAVRAEATLGEVCDVLRGVFGTWDEPTLY